LVSTNADILAASQSDLALPARKRLAMLEFDEFPAILEMAEIASHEWQEEVEVLFEKGRLWLEFPSPMLRNTPARVELAQLGREQRNDIVKAPWTWAFRRQAEAFISEVAEGREPLASGRDAVSTICDSPSRSGGAASLLRTIHGYCDSASSTFPTTAARCWSSPIQNGIRNSRLLRSWVTDISPDTRPNRRPASESCRGT